MRDWLKISAVLSALLLSYLAYAGTPAGSDGARQGAVEAFHPGISVIFNRK